MVHRPYRVDGIDFHLTLIEAGGNGSPTRVDLLTPRVQAYGDTAIITYTLLKTFAEPGLPATFKTTNETRVFARISTEPGRWCICTNRQRALKYPLTKKAGRDCARPVRLFPTIAPTPPATSMAHPSTRSRSTERTVWSRRRPQAMSAIGRRRRIGSTASSERLRRRSRPPRR